MEEPVIVAYPEIMIGMPCFRGTRVPFKNLIDFIEGAHPFGEFLSQFPSVEREMAIQALEEAKESLLARVARGSPPRPGWEPCRCCKGPCSEAVRAS